MLIVTGLESLNFKALNRGLNKHCPLTFNEFVLARISGVQTSYNKELLVKEAG